LLPGKSACLQAPMPPANFPRFASTARKTTWSPRQTASDMPHDTQRTSQDQTFPRPRALPAKTLSPERSHQPGGERQTMIGSRFTGS